MLNLLDSWNPEDLLLESKAEVEMARILETVRAPRPGRSSPALTDGTRR